jgi:hypothetical protein
MARFPLNTIVSFRPCNECQACCTVVGVKEFDKPSWTHCQHQCDIGCAIYEERPPTCRGYHCLYSLGLLDGDERRRPDNLGVIFDLRTENEIITGERLRGEPYTIQVWEIWKGALTESSVQWIINRLKERFVVALRPVGSDHEVQMINRVAERQMAWQRPPRKDGHEGRFPA